MRRSTRRAPVVAAAASVALALGFTVAPSGRAAGTCRGQAVTIVGSEGDDRLAGTDGPDVIDGLGGNDTISGGGGDDVICGDTGDDRLVGDDGNDTCDGGAGTDSADCESVSSIP